MEENSRSEGIFTFYANVELRHHKEQQKTNVHIKLGLLI